MKVTIENNITEYVITKIKDICIGFDDNTEIKLKQIVEYDLDLDSIYNTTISFINAYQNAELENHFKGNKRNHIIYVHIDAFAATPDGMGDFRVCYDIPCDMTIRRLETNGDRSTVGAMVVELEGIVK